MVQLVWMHAYLTIDNVKQWQFCKYAMHWKLNKSTGRKKTCTGPKHQGAAARMRIRPKWLAVWCAKDK